MINERKLRYILEIAKEGSVTAAAEKLYITQPSLSNLLGSVERELGAKLFDRSVSPMPLTYAGERYVAAAESIIGTLQELQHEIDDMNHAPAGRLHIGCGPQQSPFLIPAILSVMMERYPGVQFKLTEEHRETLEEQLLRGTLDVILGGKRESHPNIESIPLNREDMMLMTPVDFQPHEVRLHVDRDHPVIDLHDYPDIPFVLMKRHHQLRRMQERILTESGCTPNVILETDNWQTCLHMVESGIAFTILPNAKVELELRPLGRYSFEREYTRQTCICYRKNAYFSKLMEAFVKVAQEVIC